MRRATILTLATFVLMPVGAAAQEDRPVARACGENDCKLSPERDRQLQAKADSLRAALECPTDVDWPPLPAEGRDVVRTRQPDRTDVTIPQYAYFYHSHPSAWGGPACLPVIVVQAQGSTFGWMAVLEPPPAAGGSYEHFFDLLGTERPRPTGPSRAEAATGQMPEVAPEVTHAVTGGYWNAGEMSGQYRLVVWHAGSEPPSSAHELQWIVVPADGGPPTVLASIPIDELDAPFWTSRAAFESRGGAPVFILEQANAEGAGGERVVEIHPVAPGEYRSAVVDETRDL